MLCTYKFVCQRKEPNSSTKITNYQWINQERKKLNLNFLTLIGVLHGGIYGRRTIHGAEITLTKYLVGFLRNLRQNIHELQQMNTGEPSTCSTANFITEDAAFPITFILEKSIRRTQFA